ERFWNAPLLSEQISRTFGVTIGPRALANHLQRLGYSWKRARYVTAQQGDFPESIG
ncbi:helix-turn-helix domain-containing protein, partial [Deinococcus sp. ME38]|uniref:helix-turn-helix domain-containing protein n=1 Tax=Deinococcus sp. ME38 TaxID=3400344 RepID=UPI003B5B082E